MSAHAGGRAAGGEPKEASDRAGPDYGRVSRVALLAGASALALPALGRSGVALAACVPSPQTVATPISGPISSNGGAITVTGSGSITGGPGGDGVDALKCPITTLANQSGGSNRGGYGAPSTRHGGAGVSNAGTITTLTNSGAIRGGNGGGGGLIDDGGAGGAGVSNAGTIKTLSNSGAIGGGNGGGGGLIDDGGAGGAGVSNADAIVTLSNGGKISGGNGGSGQSVGGVGGAGVSNAGTIKSLTNKGAIGAGGGGGFSAMAARAAQA